MAFLRFCPSNYNNYNIPTFQSIDFIGAFRTTFWCSSIRYHICSYIRLFGAFLLWHRPTKKRRNPQKRIFKLLCNCIPASYWFQPQKLSQLWPMHLIYDKCNFSTFFVRWFRMLRKSSIFVYHGEKYSHFNEMNGPLLWNTIQLTWIVVTSQSSNDAYMSHAHTDVHQFRMSCNFLLTSFWRHELKLISIGVRFYNSMLNESGGISIHAHVHGMPTIVKYNQDA